MLVGEFLRLGSKLLCGLGGLGLLGYTGLLAEVDLVVEDLHRLEHNLRRHAFLGWAGLSLTVPALRRGHEVVGEPVERIGPELRLRDRHSRLLGDVVGELPQAAERVEFLHLLNHGAKRREVSTVEIGLQVIHDRRHLLGLTDGEFPHFTQCLLHGRWLPISLTERLDRHPGDPAANRALFPRRELQPFHERTSLKAGHHGRQVIGHLRELGEELFLPDNRLIERLIGGGLTLWLW